VAARLRADGATAEFFGADVTDEDGVRGLVGAVQDWQGPVDVLVCNATGPQPVIGLEELTWPELLDPLLFFVKSPMLLVQAVLPAMKQRGRGRIVNIGSDLPERAEPGWSAYCAAKAAQLALTRVWARELGPHGITVNLVAPGWIPVERHAGTQAEVFEGYRRDVALGHLGAPGDVAAVVAFLASDAARFVTAERVAVNGGHTIA
jgi:3-oxoacyl-[acyl-carrier protein] reductase